jgi:hypothetical protein
MTILGGIIKKSITITSKIKSIRQIKPSKWQIKTLFKLLKKAKKTSFGKEYFFSEMLSITSLINKKQLYENFKTNVPIHDYNKMYNEWWHKTRAGQSNITWPGKVKYFALSSGTSEAASKTIPVTKEMIKAIHKASINQIISLGRFQELPSDTFEKGYLMLGGSTKLNQVDDHWEGDLSGITVGKMPFWFERFFKPGKAISQEKDWSNKLKTITDRANEWDIAFVAGVPAWIQILFEQIIEKHKVKNIHEIWPNLVAFGWGGVSIEPYKEGFNKLLDPKKPFIFLETYLASEGFFAYQSTPHGNLQMVLNNGIFYEFILFNSQNFDSDGNLKANAEAIMISDVEINTEYALLVSTCSGAWRYLIGDTIKFLNKKNAEIVISGRTKHFLSLCGEHLSVENMNKAITEVSAELGLTIKEFTLIGKKHNSLFAHQWYLGCNQQINELELANNIDQKLKVINDDYAVERNHALQKINCSVLPTNVFIDWMKTKGKEGGQHKFPRVLKGQIADDWESFVKNYKNKSKTELNNLVSIK